MLLATVNRCATSISNIWLHNKRVIRIANEVVRLLKLRHGNTTHTLRSYHPNPCNTRGSGLPRNSYVGFNCQGRNNLTQRNEQAHVAHHGAISRLVAKPLCGSSVRYQIRKLSLANRRNTGATPLVKQSAQQPNSNVVSLRTLCVSERSGLCPLK